MIVELNKAFQDIWYFDKDHTYKNLNTGKQLIPTTTYKKQFQNGFENADYWLTKKAKEAGITKQEMQEQWDEKRIVGTTRGSIIHDLTEHLTHRKVMDWSLNMTGMAILKRQVKNYIKDYKTDITIATELVCGNNFIGGQIDKLFDRKSKLWIGDYKTDSKTEEELTRSYGKKLKGKLNYMDDTILNGYFIQLNLYRQILEEKDFEIEGMEIYHFCIHNQNYKTYIVPKFDVI